MNFELTPLGARRPRLPLQRKVKQLQRPWQDSKPGAAAVPHHVVWTASLQRRENVSSGRPRSGPPATSVSVRRGLVKSASIGSYGVTCTRKRPSTGCSTSSSTSMKAKSWTTQQATLFKTVSKEWKPVAHRERICAVNEGSDIESGHTSNLGRTEQREEHSTHIADADITLHSSLSMPSYFSTSASEPGKKSGHVVPPTIRGDTIRLSNETKATEPVPAPSQNSLPYVDAVLALHNASVDTISDPAVTAGAHAEQKERRDQNAPRRTTTKDFTPASRRPSSAGVAPARGSSVAFFALQGNNFTRPHTACACRSRIESAPGSFDASGDIVDCRHAYIDNSYPFDDRLANTPPMGGRSGGVDSESGFRDTESSIEAKVSVEVMLPVLEDTKGTRDRRFRPGSAVGPACRERSEKSATPKARGPSHNEKQAEANCSYRTPGQRPRRKHGITVAATAEQPRAPSIGVLGYFVAEDSTRKISVYNGPLHGRALSRNDRPSSFKRPLSPAIKPGEQPFGAAHPLSPTNMGSPPRRHRNSNWGEEGMRLAEEEETNARQTVPFVVSGTLLGWKLSTRDRKKSLEDSLEAADYSEHHLIPVYGFRSAHDVDGAGVEERRVGLRRLEERALVAERAALERQARAEGGVGGAAFARAMSRRALAKSARIQKVGDVHDVRKDKVFQSSSPKSISSYQRRVKGRIQGERTRRRTLRGLSSHRPPRIRAVTSRADLQRARDGQAQNRAQGETPHVTALDHGPELQAEPYLRLVRARNDTRVHGIAENDVPFCTECMGDCMGACSPDAKS